MSLPLQIGRTIAGCIVFLTCTSGLLLTSCKNESKPEKESRVDKPRPIPDDSVGYVNFSILKKLLNLEDNNMVNEVEYRIWFGINPSEIGRVIVIKRLNGSWQASKHDYMITKVDQATSLIDSIKVLPVNSSVPKSGNAEFQKKIDDLKIDTFRDYAEIPRYEDCVGTSAINVEIFHAKSYGKVSYPCPDVNKEDIKELKALREVFKLVEDQFGFDLSFENPYGLHIKNVDSARDKFRK